MKSFLVGLCLLIPVVAFALDITFTWTPNVDEGLAGYKLYCSGNSTKPFTFMKSTTTTSITVSLPIETVKQYCAVTAYNDYNLESDYSNTVILYKLTKPVKPVGFIRN